MVLFLRDCLVTLWQDYIRHCESHVCSASASRKQWLYFPFSLQISDGCLSLENYNQESNWKREGREYISHLIFHDVEEVLEGDSDETKLTTDAHVSSIPGQAGIYTTPLLVIIKHLS